MKKTKTNILEFIYIIITIIFILFLTIEKVENGNAGGPEKGPIGKIAFKIALISLIFIIFKYINIKKAKINESIKNDYNQLLVGIIVLQQSIIVNLSTMVVGFYMHFTDKTWMFYSKYLVIVVYFILQMILYFALYKKQINKDKFSFMKYITISIFIIPILVVSRFILGH